jgi:aryl carrier-like protein
VEVVFSQSTDDIDVTVVAAGDHFSGRAQGFYVAFEQVLRDVVSDTETYLFSHSSTGKPQQPLQQDTPAVPKTFNEQAFNTIKAELCDLLGVRAEDANADSSLISLGLDSLKAVALSRRLESKDLHVSPVDIIQSSTLGDLATVPTSALSSSEPSDVLADLERKLSQELDIPSLSLDSADKPSVTPATALQSGMLSQVIFSLI